MQDRSPFNNRALIGLLIPLFFEQLLSITIGMADTVMVSFVGEHAVSAVSLVDVFNLLLIQIFSALAAGGAVVASQYVGRHDRLAASEAGRQLLYSSVIIAVALMAPALILRRAALGWFYGSVDPFIMSNAVTYFTISVVSYPFLAAYNSCAALMRSVGDSKTPMFISIAMNLVNVAGNAIMIYWMGMGVAGAAYASLFARMLGAAGVVFLLSKPTARISLYPIHRFNMKWDMIRRILRIGVPNGLENSIFQIGKVLVSNLVSTLGTAAIAANAIAGVIFGFISVPGSAVSICLVTVVGQCMGAGRSDQADKNAKKLMLMAHGAMVVASGAVLLFLRPLLGRFSLSPEAFEIAHRIISFALLSTFLFWPPAFALPNALRASGDVKFTMAISIASMWAFRIGFSYLLCNVFQMGIMGIWMAMIIDWVVRGAFFTGRFLKGSWRGLKVI